jgi:hypothetical protein
LPDPPSDIGDPGQRSAAAERGSCVGEIKELKAVKEKQLTALVPEYASNHPGLVWGKTSNPRPTFWVYVPVSGSHLGKFVLQDSHKRTVYQTPVTLSGTPGAVGVTLPKKVSLKTEQAYHWFFNFYCAPRQDMLSFVDGWVTRKQNSAMSNQLLKATREKSVVVLAHNGFWYDALTAAAELKLAKGQDTDWDSLLRSVGLAEIASRPTLLVQVH